MILKFYCHFNKSWTVFLIAFSSGFAFAELGDWEKPEPSHVMQGMSLQWVGENIRHNGIPMSTATFTLKAKKSKLEDYYINWFSNRGSEKYIKNTINGYTVLGAKIKNTFYSVRYKDAGHNLTVGSVSSSFMKNDVNRSDYKNVKPIFIFNGSAELINRVESIDDEVYSDVSTYIFNLPRSYVSRWMGRVLRENGWSKQSVSGNETEKTMFQRNDEHAEVSLANDPLGDSGKTVVNVIWVKGS